MNDTHSITPLFESLQLYKLPESAEGIKFQGDNRGRVVLICKSASAPEGEEKEMLTKMLAALKVKWDDVALICVEDGYPFKQLKKHLVFHKMISFGLAPGELGLNVAPDNYRLLNFYDTKIIFSEPLAELKENRNNAKDRLWRAVKEMFA